MLQAQSSSAADEAGCARLGRLPHGAVDETEDAGTRGRLPVEACTEVWDRHVLQCRIGVSLLQVPQVEFAVQTPAGTVAVTRTHVEAIGAAGESEIIHREPVVALIVRALNEDLVGTREPVTESTAQGVYIPVPIVVVDSCETRGHVVEIQSLERPTDTSGNRSETFVDSGERLCAGERGRKESVYVVG